MEALRQFVKVKNHTIQIILPDDFDADEVEVIIMPIEKKAYAIPDWQMEKVRERNENYLKNPAIAEDFNQAISDIENEI